MNKAQALWDRAINFDIRGISPLVGLLMLGTMAAVCGLPALALVTRPVATLVTAGLAVLAAGAVFIVKEAW